MRIILIPRDIALRGECRAKQVRSGSFRADLFVLSVLFSVCMFVCSSWVLHASQHHGTPPKYKVHQLLAARRLECASHSGSPRIELPAACGVRLPACVLGRSGRLCPRPPGRSPSYMVGTASRIVVLVRIDVLVQLLVLVPMGSNS